MSNGRLGGLLLISLLSISTPAWSEVIPVPVKESGFLGSSDPTLTFLWEARNPKAVLIMIPGGEGHLGLTAARTELGGFYGRLLKPLSDHTTSSGSVHVVVFDSPYRLPVGDTYPTSRGTGDHLERIRSVVAFYQEKFGKPVWLLGHSNGAISVAEFIRDHASMVAGAIFSSSRVGVKVSSDIAFPVLFLHHRMESCSKANPRSDETVFESLRSAGKTNTDFVWIEGGAQEDKHPCHSGYHMFFGAEDATFKAIDNFLVSH